MTKNLYEMLEENPYPGRGIVLGLAENGKTAMMAYFIMGRSENSRNRRFVLENGALHTRAAKPEKLKDPSLIIYRAVQAVGEGSLLANGTHGDDIAAALAAGQCLAQGVEQTSFEPDAPVYTPRIVGLLHLGYGGFSYQLALAKSEGKGKSTQRAIFQYPLPLPGTGHFLHTYARSVPSLPAFSGQPHTVHIENSLDAFAENIWRSLNSDNKISLFVRSVGLAGQEETRIFNQY